MDQFSRPSWPRHTLLLLACFLIGISLAQKDPEDNFCRRFGQQTAVVDRKLYIDGGIINYQPPRENFTNTFFTYNDLDSISDGDMPEFHTGLSKNGSIPSVEGGILWEDSINKRLYLYGGEFEDGPTEPFNLYSYDILYDEWHTYGSPPNSVKAASYGAGVSIPSRGEAYYYGGWLSDKSVQDWQGEKVASSGLIKYTMDSNKWSNVTGPDDTGRAEGVMVFLPVGDDGMLVYFGGGQDLHGNGTLEPQPMDEILLYDVANARWYTQKTSGDAPNDRRRFCGGATWAQDRSSYNIYIFGGRGFPPHETGYDDIYILTIPSFQWIRGPYPGYENGTGTYPKSMMSCNVIDNTQMLVIGGSYANATEKECDVPSIQGVHNMNLGKQNDEDAIWARYQDDLTTYEVPVDIRKSIGGSAKGGASETTPISGFNDPDLEVLMTRTAESGTRSATRATSTSTKTAAPSASDEPSSSSLSTGAIAGIAVGCSVASILALLGCGLLIYRRRKHYSGPRGVAAPPPQGETAMAHNPMSPGQSTSPGGWDPNQVSSPAGTTPSHGVASVVWPARNRSASELTGHPDLKRNERPVELPADENMHDMHRSELSPMSNATPPQSEWSHRY
ncbi:unnamed protein product [Fusarium graminearum]|nr:hypothetical protein HG531_009343 [Fusarium graminearum]CAF3455230.1 unnamed protein product [Fusarium graminearum]CAG1992588.1 unnamed protein product [Fusarium graminearum]VTO90799.1 unnamed protein product [Fusarium graminearum]